MINAGIKALAQIDDPNQAWRTFISDDDIVALKFNCIGEKELGTNTVVCEAILNQLFDAGFKAENIIIVGLQNLPDNAQQTRPWHYGWQDETVDFGSDRDHLTLWLKEATAIINIPSIMDDNIIQLRGCLANLSFPLVKSPARLYLNRGDPFINEIYSLPEIRAKVRFHLANGLRILYYGGPKVSQTYIYEHGSLIFATDPVALDHVCLQLINRARRNLPLPQYVPVKINADYLKTAEALGLGYNDLNFIDYSFSKFEQW